MYADINGKFFDKTSSQAKKDAIQNLGEEDQKLEDSLIWEDLETTLDDLEINENEINAAVSNNLGSFSIKIPLDIDDFTKIVDIAIKKLNKFKTVLEGLK